MPFTRSSDVEEFLLGTIGTKCARSATKRPCSSVVEHSLGKGEVARSIRAMGTNSGRAKVQSYFRPEE